MITIKPLMLLNVKGNNLSYVGRRQKRDNKSRIPLICALFYLQCKCSTFSNFSNSPLCALLSITWKNPSIQPFHSLWWVTFGLSFGSIIYKIIFFLERRTPQTTTQNSNLNQNYLLRNLERAREQTLTLNRGVRG